MRLACSLVMLLSGVLVARGEEAPNDAPLTWHLSLKKGVEAAKKKNRPIVLVFWATGSRAFEWFSKTSTISGEFTTVDGVKVSKKIYPGRRKVHATNVVLIKLLPPVILKLPAGTTSGQAERYRKVYKILADRYRKVATKYGVTRLPTVVFLSPDGNTILHKYTRKSENTVLSGLKKIDGWFRAWKQTQELLKEIEAAKPKK